MKRSFITSIACALALSGLSIACNQNKDAESNQAQPEAVPAEQPSTKPEKAQPAPAKRADDKAADEAADDSNKQKHRAM